MKEGISKGMNMKWSLHMSSNQQNLTIGSIGLKSDYRVVKISLTTGLGSYPDKGERLSKATHSALGDINAFSMATLHCRRGLCDCCFLSSARKALGKFGRSNGLNEAWHT